MRYALLHKRLFIPLTALSLSLGIILWPVHPRQEAPPTSPPILEPGDSSSALMIKDFSIAVYNDVSKSFSKLDADDLHVEPKKVYIFNIKSLNYAIINNAK